MVMQSTVTVQTLAPKTMLLLIAVSLALVAFSQLVLRTRKRYRSSSILARAMVGVPEIHQLKARSREGAIHEMVEIAARMLRWPGEDSILQGVMKRESQLATGLVHGIAVPHARFLKLGRSLVLFGRAPHGIEWDCLDGRPARLIFLILSPEEDEHAQLHMLAEIGRCADDPRCLEILEAARDCKAITRAIERSSEGKRHHRWSVPVDPSENEIS